MTPSFAKGHFYGLCCLKFSYATSFTSLRTFILQIILIIQYSEDKNTGFIVNNLEQ